MKHLRGLCIIRLAGLLIFAGAANICAAAEAQGAGSSAGASVSIRDPQAYMSKFASTLNPESMGLLTKGLPTPAAKPVRPSQTTKALPAAPSPVSAPTPTAIPNPAGAQTPAVVPFVKPVIGSVATVAKPAGIPLPVVKTAPAPVQKSVPIVGTTPVPEAPKPAAQATMPRVWNGLSPDNGAAQRAMEQMNALRAKAAVAAAAEQNPQQTVATNTVVAATATPVAPSVQPLNQTLLSAKPGLTLWNKPAAANLADKVVLDASAPIDPNFAKILANDPNAAKAATSEEKKPWKLGSDLDKYRAHAVKEGSRDSGESLKKALERAGMTIGDGVNVFILGYGSDKAKPFRANDGKGLLDDPGKVPQQAGKAVVSLADGMYSLADLITFDALPDPIKDVYKDNNPLVRPLIFTGRAIGGVWKTTEEVGNAVTWGYFDNVTGCVGIVIEDILELFKHVGQAATNVVRAPVQLLAGGKKEGVERAMDWVLLVPLEYVSNSVEMKGIANMEEYKTAFEDKGVIGSVLEFGGSTFLVYRAVDEMVDELKDKNHHKHTSSSETPVDDHPVDPPVTPTNPTGSDLLFIVDGEWPTATSGSGIVIFEGEIPTITVLVE